MRTYSTNPAAPSVRRSSSRSPTSSAAARPPARSARLTRGHHRDGARRFIGLVKEADAGRFSLDDSVIEEAELLIWDLVHA
jgi:hypothetical protein